jgi:hypothetical protein
VTENETLPPGAGQLDIETSRRLARKVRAQPGCCWDNAARALARWTGAPANLVYVRGIVLWSMPFLHAWLQTGATIVDPTLVLVLTQDQLREDVRYFAVDTLPADQVKALVKRRALRGLQVHDRDLNAPPFDALWQATLALFMKIRSKEG